MPVISFVPRQSGGHTMPCLRPPRPSALLARVLLCTIVFCQQSGFQLDSTLPPCKFPYEQDKRRQAGDGCRIVEGSNSAAVAGSTNWQVAAAMPRGNLFGLLHTMDTTIHKGFFMQRSLQQGFGSKTDEWRA